MVSSHNVNAHFSLLPIHLSFEFIYSSVDYFEFVLESVRRCHAVSPFLAPTRLRISNFWSHENRLPVDTLERMIALLECMYSPTTEDKYLSYSTSLLLEMTSKSPDYKREMFEHPLSQCHFQVNKR